MSNKRSIYLIDPKFQIKFSFFVCSLVFLSSLVYPITIYELIESLTLQLNSTQAAVALKNSRLKLMIALGIFQLGFISLVFIICIFQSHKIAGPVYKLKKYLSGINQGNPLEKLYFRKGDHFQDVADVLNETLDKIQNNHNKDFMYIGEVISYINNLALIVPEDKKPVLMAITSQLSEIQDRFKG